MKYTFLYDSYQPTMGEMRPFAIFVPLSSPTLVASILTRQGLTTSTPYVNSLTAIDMPVFLQNYITKAISQSDVGIPLNRGAYQASFDGVMETFHMAWGDRGASYLEVEVPYWSEYHTKMCGFDTMCAVQSLSGSQQLMPFGMSNQTGLIIFGITIQDNTTSAPTGGVGTFTVYQSVGDDFTMGVLLPPPPSMIVGGWSTAPALPGVTMMPFGIDTYPIAPQPA